MPELGEPTTLPDLARFVLALLLDVSLKATLLLALAGLVAGLLRRASAATRHLAWTLAVCAALLLPVLALTVPAWRVAALARVPFLAGTVAPLAAAPPAPDVSTPLFSLDAPLSVREGGQAEASPDAQPSGVSGSPAPYPKALLATLAGWYEAVRSMHWAVWLLLVWLVGAGVIGSRLMVGAGGVLWLALGARRIDDPSWLAQAEAVGRELGLRRTVRLLRSTRTAMPMTWGLLRPVVLLPVGASDWTSARRRSVLIHEMAHIQRFDCLTQTLAQLAGAVYWFNPLVWVAARAMRRERERACDDSVLTFGVRPSTYAMHLLEIVRSTSTTRLVPLGAVEMARVSQLEGRVLALLDATRSRRKVAPWLQATAILSALILAIPLAALRPGAPDAAAADGPPAFATVETTRGPAGHWKGVVPSGGTVSVDLASGDVQATLSPDGAVEAFVLGIPEGAQAAIHRSAEGLTVRVGAAADSCDCSEKSGTSPSVLVRIPAGVHFAVRTRSGDVKAVGLQGDVEAASETGDVYAASSGVIRARTVDGDVVLRTASFGEARSVNGDIHARIGRTAWNGGLPFRTENGDITVDLPADAETAIDLYVRAEGSLRTALPLRRKGNETGTRLFGVLGSGDRLLSVHTTRGDVTITYAGTQHLEPYEQYELRPELDQSQRYRADADNARRSETRVRSAVEGVLAAVDEADVQTLTRMAVHDARVAVRTAATEALTHRDCPDVLPVLLEALEDVHRDVRRTAARGLGAYQDQRAIEALRGALDDAERVVRREAAQALAGLTAAGSMVKTAPSASETDEQAQGDVGSMALRLMDTSLDMAVEALSDLQNEAGPTAGQ